MVSMALFMSSRKHFTSSHQLNLLSISLPKWQCPLDSQGQAKEAMPVHGVNQKRHFEILEGPRRTTSLSNCPSATATFVELSLRRLSRTSCQVVGGSVVKNPPCSVGDMGFIPRRFHLSVLKLRPKARSQVN